jgi:formylmethanofuran dehydrogenase subunit C
MSALTFTLKAPLQHKLDVSALTPDVLAGKSAVEIAATPLQIGNKQIAASEFFSITGEDTQSIVFANSSDKLDRIGQGLRSGSISVQGNAGVYLGYEMRAGKISVQGNAGDFAASGMAGGLIHIQGNVGDFLGAAIAGNRKGMKGGTVIVTGNAGDRVGDQMRRGIILIEGDTGAYCASRMLAGTIGVLGSTGAYTGYSMRRGTLLLCKTPQLIPTLQDCGAHTLPYLSLMFKSFAELPTAFAKLAKNRVQRYAGDLANDGKGEILVLI